LLFQKRKNLICNFRASTLEDYEEWQNFKRKCKLQNLDICYVNISLIKAWNNSQEGIEIPETIKTPNGIIYNIQMQNNFIYQPQRPRRLPQPSIISSKRPFARTISSRAAELYLLWKVSGLNRSFSYLDLSELPSDYTRKLILRLKRKGLIKPVPPRTRPRFYIPLVSVIIKDRRELYSEIIK
jgi:hypothetical protein